MRKVMGGRALLAGGAVCLVAAGPGSRAATNCAPTVNDCFAAADPTTTHLQLGGPGSLSSNAACDGYPSCNDPGRLDNGSLADGMLSLTLDRAAGRLTIELDNTTATTASLTGIYFNTPPSVTGLAVIGGSLSKTCPPAGTACPALSNWTVTFDPGSIATDGFGKFDAFVGNGGDPGQVGGGDPVELAAGETLTLDLAVSGTLTGLTACSFMAEGSKVAPGETVTTGVGRFQGGANGGDAGWLGPCSGGELFVDLKFFQAEGEGGKVILRWETAGELDTAGFNVLRRPELGLAWERANDRLIPAQGDSLSGAAYRFDDVGLPDGVRYEYRLEEIDTHGFNALDPPEMAVPNPTAPAIRLAAPAYGAPFQPGDPIVLAWRTGLRVPLRLQFSADPSFPVSSRVEFPARSSRRDGVFEMALDRHEQILVSAVIGGSATGQIYWRVVEAPRTSSRGASSEVWRFGASR